MHNCITIIHRQIKNYVKSNINNFSSFDYWSFRLQVILKCKLFKFNCYLPTDVVLWISAGGGGTELYLLKYMLAILRPDVVPYEKKFRLKTRLHSFNFFLLRNISSKGSAILRHYSYGIVGVFHHKLGLTLLLQVLADHDFVFLKKNITNYLK